ncbi:MAG TPA: branched-chain amino acid ABC transporter permease [Terriglobales bacterium]|nr:branched-chain amino acid ABC transporter permease [Terriglobales bacterium]
MTAAPVMQQPQRTPKWVSGAALAAGIILLIVLPLVIGSTNFVRLLFLTLLWVTTSIAWNLLGGFAGQVSFGFAVFYGVGAYTTALAINGKVNPFLAFLMGAVAAAIISVFLGLPTFRLRGPYFAIATIGISEAVRVVMTNVGFTGGASGYRILEARPFEQFEHYFTALALAMIALVVSAKIANAKFGLGLKAIRQDEDAAADVGVNPFTNKLAVHAIAAAMTGAAGGVFARYAAFIHPNGVFGFQTGVHILLMPVIGGIATVWGPVVGGFVFGIVEEEIVASFPQIHLLLYGSLLILIIMFEPGGILGGVREVIRRYRGGRKH